MPLSYWEQRSVDRMEHYLRDSQQAIDITAKAYDHALRDIEANIERIFAKYVKDNDLTRDEANAYLLEPITRAEQDRLLRQVAEITDPDMRRTITARLNAPAYRYRMSREQAVAESIHARMAQVAAIETKANYESFTRTIHDAYSRNIFDIQQRSGYGFSFSDINSQQVQEILRNPWSGEHFSSRIWGNTQTLAEIMADTITSGFLSGKSIYGMARELADDTDAGMGAAVRLVRTETNFMANSAEMQSYKEAGISKYEFMAAMDGKTSKKCRELDGQVYAVENAEPGKNMPPMHPHCRSTTVAHFDDVDLSAMKRRARDPVTGEEVLVPRTMTYEQWHDTLIEKHGKLQVDVAEYKAQHEGQDRAQYARYKERLGKDAPKTFATFQNVKYTDGAQWDELKFTYRQYR